jgi:signal transduction histidine kinase
VEAAKVTFARRIAIGAIAASLVPLLFAALIFANLKEGTRKREQVLLAQKALVLAGLLERLVIDMETGVRGFRIKGEEAFLEPYNEAAAQYPKVLSSLQAVLGSEEERELLGEIRKGVERWRTDLVEPRIAAIRASPPVAMERGILLPALPEPLDMEAGKEQMDALRAKFDALGSRQRERGETLIRERTRTDTDLSRLLWMGALGFSALMFAGSIYLLRLFDRRTGVLFAGIAAVERGEYRPVALPGSDELARIAEAFNRMVAAVECSDDELRRRAGELREGRERLAERSAQLEAANKELEAFAYSVSHDLRAPLRAIDGFSQVLLEDCGERLDGTGRDALGRVRAATARMAQLIDDLLRLSRVSRGELRQEDIDLSEMARGVVSELSLSEPGRHVEVHVAEGVTAEGDPELVRLVLENLLGNAFKFTSKRAEARVDFGVERLDGMPVYFVRDNGVGFDMAYVDKLFGAFQRLHAGAEFPGTGIGLATVQRVVHRHGGRIWAQAAQGEGATFRFTL